MARRIKLPRASEEMKYKCALLEEELLSWPGVQARSMFGMRAFYRGTTIFAMLPGKRTLESSGAIAYKEGGKWRRFELEDLGGALAILESARAQAGGPD
jgi:hypothetical protein